MNNDKLANVDSREGYDYQWTEDDIREYNDYLDSLDIPEPTQEQIEYTERVNRMTDRLFGLESDEKQSKPERDPRSVSVKFAKVDGKRVITQATPERLAAIEKYRKQIANGEDIEYEVNDYKQYNAERNFYLAMMRYFRRYE